MRESQKDDDWVRGGEEVRRGLDFMFPETQSVFRPLLYPICSQMTILHDSVEDIFDFSIFELLFAIESIK